jgi:hypothetical protein
LPGAVLVNCALSRDAALHMILERIVKRVR